MYGKVSLKIKKIYDTRISVIKINKVNNKCNNIIYEQQYKINTFITLLIKGWKV